MFRRYFDPRSVRECRSVRRRVDLWLFADHAHGMPSCGDGTPKSLNGDEGRGSEYRVIGTLDVQRIAGTVEFDGKQRLDRDHRPDRRHRPYRRLAFHLGPAVEGNLKAASICGAGDGGVRDGYDDLLLLLLVIDPGATDRMVGHPGVRAEGPGDPTRSAWDRDHGLAAAHAPPGF